MDFFDLFMISTVSCEDLVVTCHSVMSTYWSCLWVSAFIEYFVEVWAPTISGTQPSPPCIWVGHHTSISCARFLLGGSFLEVIGLTDTTICAEVLQQSFPLGCEFTIAHQLLNVERDVHNGRLWIEVSLNRGVAAAPGNSDCARHHHLLTKRQSANSPSVQPE